MAGSVPQQARRQHRFDRLRLGLLVLLALSALVYWLAPGVRLPEERVEAHIAETVAEAAEEVAELGAAGAH